jgi:hypothetical protein
MNISLVNSHKCIGVLEMGKMVLQSKTALRGTLVATLLLAVGACSSVEKVRKAADVIVAGQHKIQVEALVQAEIERQRLRGARCYSPFLTPATISAASQHPSLGENWVDELMRDCPQFSAFMAELLLRRAIDIGLPVLQPSHGARK